MARLKSPNGATVEVSDDSADRLVAYGYQPIEEKSEKKTAPKKSGRK